VEKYGRDGQATNGNIIRRMRFACRIIKQYTQVTISNTHCFSTPTMVTITCLIVNLYVHCLSWFTVAITVSIARQLATSILLLLGGHVTQFLRCNLEQCFTPITTIISKFFTIFHLLRHVFRSFVV